MICPSCGAKVDSGFNFCVECGSRLDIPQEPDYGQADMGGYHSEEEFPEGTGGFVMSAGTFVISDRSSSGSASDMYTADELNDSDEEFDFSIYDNAAEEQAEMPAPQAEPARPVNTVLPGYYPGQAQPQYAVPGAMQYGVPGTQMQQPQYAQPYPQTAQYPGAIPAPQPQIIGYDQNGMPVYGQPQMMYGQPQFIGYDQNGMPLYSQPQMMYGQPQFIGYDQNGAPLYSQPQMMYGQPQFIGYDQNGMPLYSQPQPVPEQQYQQMPDPRSRQVREQPQQEQPQHSQEEGFWEFFGDGNGKQHHEEADFFGKSEHAAGKKTYSPYGSSGEVRPPEKKQEEYMSDTPMVDASDLAPNDSHKYNRYYMRKAEMVNADDMQANPERKHRDYMDPAGEADPDKLSANEHYRSRITMHAAGTADPDDLRSYTPGEKLRSDMMREAYRPVDALPKKKKYVDPTDEIELPENMKAKKTVKDDRVQIPDLPKVGIE